jgi:cellulose synthase/poly-beta-1,6-N-acetylglucosamine synthase-like glycosyltransferase
MSWELRFSVTGGFLVLIFLLLRWIFHPAIISSQRDRLGTKADQFYVRKKQQTKFAQQIFCSPSCDLTLVIPAYNEEERLPVMLNEAIKFLKDWTKRQEISYEVRREEQTTR